MGNILIGFKRFIKSKNTVTIIAILAALSILYAAYNYRIKKATEPRNVPYATRTLGPRELISADAFAMKKIPGSLANTNVVTDKKDILNKYVSNKAVIPEGSVFYKSMVVDLDDLPMTLFENIPEGNTVFNLPVDINSTYGNSIFPGNSIDLYVQSSENGKPYVGRFIKCIKVLAVVDSKGDNVFETVDNPKVPAYLMFSVPDEYFTLLKLASFQSIRIFPVPRNAVFSAQDCETSIVSQQIQNKIESDANMLYSGGNKDTEGGAN